MSAVPAQRQTLTIVSGFLGSGKTTWLRHQLHAGEFRGAVVLVNEAAAAPVDDALLADLARVIVLPGGCACCDKRSEFLSLLAGLVDEKMRSGEAGGHIVLETSGLADPAALVEAIRSHPMLAHHIVVDEVIVTVDAGCGLANIRTNRLVAKQIEGADRVIVTKMDSVPSAACSALCATIARINPGARLSGAMNGEAMALPPFDPTTAVLPGAGDDRRPVIAVELDVDPSSEWAVFSVWLSALLHARGDDIYRVKGVVRTPAGRILLQCVQKSVLQPRILPAAESASTAFDNRLAVIGKGFDPARLRDSLRDFCG